MKRKSNITNFFLKKQKSGADQGQTNPSPSVSCRSEPYVGGGQGSQEKDDDTQEPSVSPAEEEQSETVISTSDEEDGEPVLIEKEDNALNSPHPAQASHVHQKGQVHNVAYVS
ncbi:unnamed protein product [Leuciscus chuanchicus]